MRILNVGLFPIYQLRGHLVTTPQYWGVVTKTPERERSRGTGMNRRDLHALV